MLSIVIPIDLLRRPSNLLKRLKHIVCAARSSSFQVVIGHHDRGQIGDAKLKELLKNEPGVTLVSKKFDFFETSQAALRNLAVSSAEFEIILFLDADIYADSELFQYLACCVADGEPYAMLPCLYLTPTGTKELLSRKNGVDIVNDFLQFNRKKVLHLAMPSSVIAMRKADYFSLGGFNEAYKGHGYEDFDFMMRLLIKSSKLTVAGEILVDKPYRAPLLSEGFRAVLAERCLPHVLEKKFAFHLWHPRNGKESYYLRRSENAKIFQGELRKSLNLNCGMEINSGVPFLIEPFFRACMEKGYKPTDFYALFHAAPCHQGRSRLSDWAAKIFCSFA